MSKKDYTFDDLFSTRDHRGYVPSYAATRSSMLDDFKRKSALLRAAYPEVFADEFIYDLFCGEDEALENLMVVISGDDSDDNGTYKVLSRDDLLLLQEGRSDVFISPSTFIHGCYRRTLMQDLYAFVIDIDDVKPHVINHIIGQNCYGATFVVNSGQGIHLYFSLVEPVPYYKKNRKELQQVYTRLYARIKDSIMADVDWHSLIQPFRMPGSKTKLGVPAVAFRCGEPWSIFDLAKELNMDFTGTIERGPVIEFQEDYNDEKRKKQTGRFCPVCGCELVLRESERGSFVGCSGYPRCTYKEDLEGNRIENRKRKRTRINQSFYDYCLARVMNETKEGNRYMSMVGLTMVAYKSGIEKNQVAEDLEKLMEHFNLKGSQMKPKEIDKALRAYNHKAVITSSEKLEQMFGWTFSKKHKIIKEATSIDWDKLQKEINENEQLRNNLEEAGVLNENGTVNKRRYSLRRARMLRDQNQAERGQSWNQNAGRKNKSYIVRDWKESHPGGTKAACIRETGLSKMTVYKWWD